MIYRIPADRAAKWNYRPGKRATSWHGVPVKVEIEAGDTKSGYDEDGNYWEHKYEFPYGEFPGTRSPHDGDGVDLYLGPATGASLVYVVHQLTKTGELDEDKVMLDFASHGDAVLAYRRHGPPWGIGGVSTMTVDQFINGYLHGARKL